jgi:tRNA(Arg) A34 adenosine deaminase TadA
MTGKEFLQLAIEKAKESVSQGGFPAGAIVVKDGKIVGEGISIGNKLNDPTTHGEMAAIRNACKNLKTTDLSGVILYSSLEPCFMCLGAAMWSSISKIVYACSKEKVSADYYGGHYQNSEINKSLINPIELVHLSELEEKSLAIIRGWEDSLSPKIN